jgi:uncharacterized membrane protein YkvA (DUF1232 family)
MPSPLKTLGPIAFIKATWFVWRDKQTPLWSKLLFGALALGYLVLPIDLIPDFALGLGQLDDIAIITVLAWFATKFAPRFVQQRAKDRATQGRKVVKNERLKTT